ncbi:MAG TPA: nucleoside triphosphate pyrophosphohydrolase [Candidatus Paceibacterota bacterium]|nr:nucleoside triphosphate pyrophosphohydrolase [Candidatus Paceibacterota bacterium]
MKNFEKLVRDGYIEKIRRKGEQVPHRQATDEEMRFYLARKIREEAKEVCKALMRAKEGSNMHPNAEVVEELGDVCDAIDEITAFCGISIDEIEESRKQKNATYGGFRGRWILNTI